MQVIHPNEAWKNVHPDNVFDVVNDHGVRCGRGYVVYQYQPAIYPDKPVHRGCFGNLAAALAPYGIAEDAIPSAFNCFMNVPVDEQGKISVEPPISKAGDFIRFRAEQNLVIGLTACSAYASNGGHFKPIDYRIDR